jgi:dTDP-glucose pyrophosphorylase/predicted GNAT family acetyltransferase
MKAIILAAWEGTRLKPITNDIPKVLVEICGKTLLEYTLDTVFTYVDEIIIVIKYKWDLIKEKIGEYYKGVKITYVTQWDIKGTGAALKDIKRKWEILILYSDTIIHPKDVKKVAHHTWWAILGKEVEHPGKYGVLKIDKKWHLEQIVEKPKEFVGNLVSFGVYKTDGHIFDTLEQITLSPRWELELTDAINIIAQKEKIQVLQVKHSLYDITTKEDIESAEKALLKEHKKYTIKKLEKKEFIKHFYSFIDTLENLKPTGEISKKRLKKFFEMSLKQWPTFVAQKDDGDIIGTLKVLIEPKLLRGGQFAAKFEDISVRKWYQGVGIGSALMKKALKYCEKKGVYKITLSCREEILSFYEKYGFVRHSTNMKLYMKK